MQHVEVEGLGVDAAFGHRQAIEGGAVFGVDEGRALAGVPGQALGEKERAEGFGSTISVLLCKTGLSDLV